METCQNQSCEWKPITHSVPLQNDESNDCDIDMDMDLYTLNVGSSHQVIQDSERPGHLETLLNLPSLSHSIKLKHSWNSDDSSENIYVKDGDPFTFHRLPLAKSTDAIRGKIGYREGIHIWEVRWPLQERGTHAVVGVATREAALQCDGYYGLVGRDAESWGWDIVRGVAVHNSDCLPKRLYPRVTETVAFFDENSNHGYNLYEVPEVFYVVLDMDEGTLSFIVNDQFLGVAFRDLKGLTLYPIISAVWGHCEVTMTYINGLPPQPMSLMHLSRVAIRRKVVEIGGRSALKKLDDLNYPATLKDYLCHRVRLLPC